MVESKNGQRAIGVLLLLLGGGGTAWSWHTALTEGYYYRNAVMGLPAFAILGLTAILFPMDMAEFRAKYGVDKPYSLEHLPPSWVVMLFIAVLAGLGNWLAISR